MTGKKYGKSCRPMLDKGLPAHDAVLNFFNDKS